MKMKLMSKKPTSRKSGVSIEGRWSFRLREGIFPLYTNQSLLLFYYCCYHHYYYIYFFELV
jgi:hypothetical protein